MKKQLKNLITALIFFMIFLGVFDYLSSQKRVSIQRIDNAILYTVSGHDSTRIYRYSEKVPAFTDKDYRAELARAYRAASERYKIDVFLLISMSYIETIFRADLAGDRGKSVGIMQVGKMGRRICKFDMSSVEGQILSGACWLDAGREWCGNIRGGLSAYACGKCQPVNVRTQRAVKIRFRLAEILSNLIEL